MKILSLHIENFGKFSGYDHVFSDGLNVINAPNAWGKTTLSTFIKAMFYGMEKKGNLKAYAAERSKYLPWQGGLYGGSLMFEAKGKQYRVLRTFGPTPEADRFELVDLATNKQSKDFSANLGEELFGVGRDTFSISTFFPQGMLEGEINDEVRASLSGAKVFGSDLENHSLAVKKLKAQSRELNLQNPKAYEIISCEQAIEDGKMELENLEEEKVKLKERRSELENSARELKACEVEPGEELSKLNTKQQELSEQKRKAEENKNSILSKRKKVKASQLALGILSAILIVIGGIGFCIVDISLTAEIVLLAVGAVAAAITLILIKYVKDFGQINLSKFEKKLAELDKQIEENRKKVDDFSLQTAAAVNSIKQKGEIEKELAVCEVNLAHVEKNISQVLESIDENEVKLDFLKSKKSETDKKLFILSAVLDFLNKAQENVSQRYVQPMQNKFSELISQLSNDKTIKLDVDLNLAIDTQIGLKEKQFLSRGKQDLVEICKRFALIESIYEEEKPFIVLDDPFVNLDEPSLDASLKLISQFSTHYQIIHLVCHSSRAK